MKLPAAAIALLALAAPEAGRTFAVGQGSAVAYRLVHKLHTVEGVSRAIEGRARVLADGGVQVMVRARVDSFDSGNGNRDADMRAATEAARFPSVTFKAAGRLPRLPSAGETAEVVLQGELTFHGRTRPIEAPIRVRFDTEDRATVEGTFGISLEAFEVERPSLLFVKVEDRVEITASLVVEAER